MPANVVNAKTVNSFKNAYDRDYRNDMDISIQQPISLPVHHLTSTSTSTYCSAQLSYRKPHFTQESIILVNTTYTR